MYNILTEELVSVVLRDGGRASVSLPDLYKLMMDEAVDSFPGLRAHQGHAWHAFLVQVGTAATHRAGLDDLPTSTADWRDALLMLGDGADAWTLVVDDFARPAFLQPPVGALSAADDYKSRVTTPDSIDVLVNAKNHDFKNLSAYHSAPEDWIFALVSLQTTGGFAGAGNYGVSRMNGGVSSRPGVSLAPLDDVGSHLKRDMSILLRERDNIIREHPMVDTGATLLWTLPWDGTKEEALTLDLLDPYYIEICRRIRLLASESGGIHGIRASSRAARIDAKAYAGVVGDPWAPVSTQKNKQRRALTLGEGGFTYRRLLAYLTDRDNWEPPLLLRSATGEELEQGAVLVARSMVRGQGKTAGWYERQVPLGSAAVMALTQDEERREELRAIALERVAQISMVHRILSFSLQVYHCDGEPSETNTESRNKVAPWLNRLDRMIDQRFFADLQEEFEAPVEKRETMRQQWLTGFLVPTAQSVMVDGLDTLSCASIHRYKARTVAENLFGGRMQREVINPKSDDETDSEGGNEE